MREEREREEHDRPREQHVVGDLPKPPEETGQVLYEMRDELVPHGGWEREGSAPRS